jgi:hypothetical protein
MKAQQKHWTGLPNHQFFFTKPRDRSCGILPLERANADVHNMLFWAPKIQKSSPQHISKQLIKKSYEIKSNPAIPYEK